MPRLPLRRTLWKADLAWAGFVVLIAAAVGFLQHWPLVRVSWEGRLPAYLEEIRTRQLQVRFQGVKTLNLAQTHALFQKGEALFIDARPADEFEELHIPRAVNLTVEILQKQGETALPGIPRDREIVVYCGQVSCDAALKTAEELQNMGYTRVTAFLGGFRAWDEAGYPADTGK